MPDEAAQSAQKYDAVIFDLYGTLIDLPGTQEQGRARMASALGIEVDRFLEAWGRFRLQRDKGLLTVEESIVATVDYLGVAVESDAIQAAKAVRYQSIRAQLAPRPGAISLLKSLKAQEYSLGLLSNCSIEIPELWNETPFASLFDTCVFSATEGLVKPDTEIFLRALSRLGVVPQRCLYVGDGDNAELDGAARVGMTPWLLRLPHEDPCRSKSHLEAMGRWHHRNLGSFSGVLDVL